MKNSKITSITLPVFLFFFVISCAHAQNGYTPKDRKMYKQIAHMDSVMFDAFNSQNMKVLQSIFAEDVEFYNDGGGVSDYKSTMANFKAMFDRNADSGLHRDLIPGSLEVYPVPGFGAIELGIHTFTHIENGKKDVGTQKFIETWGFKKNEWKVTRLISLGH